MQQDEIMGAVMVHEDITELKKKEKELIKHQKNLNALVQERTKELKKINELLKKDITKRKKAEEALQKSERQLRLITDNAPAYIAYVGADDLRYRFVNQKFEVAFGLPSIEYGLDGGLADVLDRRKTKANFAIHNGEIEAAVIDGRR